MEDDIKSIKTDCHIIRVLLFIIIGGGYRVCLERSFYQAKNR